MASEDTHVTSDGGDVDLSDVDVLVKGLTVKRQEEIFGVKIVFMQSGINSLNVVFWTSGKICREMLQYLMRNSEGQTETGGSGLGGIGAN